MNTTPSIIEQLGRPGLWHWVRGMIARRGVCLADVADLAQVVALQAWRTRERYDASRGTVTTWLLPMIRTAVTRYRAERAGHPGLSKRQAEARGWRRPAVESMEREPVGRERSPLDAAIAAEEAVKLRAAVELLPEKLREAMELRMDGMTMEQVGRRVGRTKQAVQQRVCAAERVLMAEMELSGKQRQVIYDL